MNRNIPTCMLCLAADKPWPGFQLGSYVRITDLLANPRPRSLARTSAPAIQFFHGRARALYATDAAVIGRGWGGHPSLFQAIRATMHLEKAENPFD